MLKRKLFFAAVSAVALLGTGWAVTSGKVPYLGTASCSTEIIPSKWAQTNMAEGGTFYEALLSPQAREKVFAAKRMPIPSFASGRRVQLNYINEGKLFVYRKGPLQSLDSVDWSTLEHGNYYAIQLHGFVGVGALLEKNEKLPDNVSKAIGDHIKDWALCVAHNPRVNERSWYEGTVIKRQANFLHALNYLRDWSNLGDLKYEELIYLIDANARFLLDTEDVYSVSNHGIRQDMLLAATALTLPSHPRADEMLRVAERRLDEAAKNLFTESGIWKEHAPGYVNYVVGLMEEVRFLHDASEAFNAELFLSHAQTSLQFLVTSLLPDERIPYVGMSGAKYVKQNIWLDFDIGSFLASKAQSLSTFPDYGHAVVRGDHPNGLYLLFVASQNLPAEKRHADDLSFLLYNHGRPWITEGGHKTYEPGGMTQYLRTSYAHNTYTLNGRDFPGNVEPELETDLIGADKDRTVVSLAGYTERFHSQARFERRIAIDDFSRLTIRDRLRSAKTTARWEGRLHFPGDLETRIDGNSVSVSDPDGATMTLQFSSDAELTLSMCRGQESPICGWATASGEFGPATTLMWNVEGDSDVEIAIDWSDAKAS